MGGGRAWFAEWFTNGLGYVDSHYDPGFYTSIAGNSTVTVDSGSSASVALVVHDTTHQGAPQPHLRGLRVFHLEAGQPHLQRPLGLCVSARGRRIDRHGDCRRLALPEARDVLGHPHSDRRPDLRVLLPENNRPELGEPPNSGAHNAYNALHSRSSSVCKTLGPRWAKRSPAPPSRSGRGRSGCSSVSSPSSSPSSRLGSTCSGPSPNTSTRPRPT